MSSKRLEFNPVLPLSPMTAAELLSGVLQNREYCGMPRLHKALAFRRLTGAPPSFATLS